MTEQTTPRRIRPADRKSQLAALASALFAAHGYAHVSVADIARAAGVTAPSVYRHFADKQALLVAAVLTGGDRLQACTDRVLSRPECALDDLADELAELGVDYPQAVSMWRANSAFLTEDPVTQALPRTPPVVATRGAVTPANRPQLGDRAAVRVAWAVLSVAGSLTVHHTRLSNTRAKAALHELISRTLVLDTDTAPPFTAPTLPPSGERTRRDEILDAASELFADRGYTAVGIDDIGAAVGISGPSVYNHFPSKLSILVSITRRSATTLEAGVIAAYARTSRPGPLLRGLVDSYVAAITTSPDLVVGFRSARILPAQTDTSEHLDSQRRYVRRWIDLLRDVHPGLPSEEAAVAVHSALSIVNDAVGMRRGTARDEFTAEMAYLMKGVLGV
ncbi:TetR/AcrR family transcriptional regulator [Gordonia sp. (in: high G+C Gram-positive bacteria)]|uniref:TetR/AcrR family transcriptional regulator n=1 Tax=Gordonia sp. (in: high G+C Gram-positive bacteria) TaxID=84139 RepID=UPI002BBD53B6|nr:TetR/AcrR family transcriptional regulator [Gordonia sp. (in: high G+C Gram-positive bacteria)]HMS75519.1 TetR/AcrR family transcriptional regulator [Gordonia sp. (in: high G+C Gram-positive bacteria)]